MSKKTKADLEAEIEALRAENEELRAGQEPEVEYVPPDPVHMKIGKEDAGPLTNEGGVTPPT